MNEQAAPEHGTAFWVGVALGVPLIAYGIRGALVDSALTHPAELGRWIVGAAVVHDLLLVPVVLAAGWLVRRVVPGWAWPAVRWALVTSGILVAFAWPLVRGYGTNTTIGSLLPRNYARGLVAYLGAVWVSAAAALALPRLWQLRPRRRPAPASEPEAARRSPPPGSTR